MSNETYLIGKFTQVLGDTISYRESKPKNRTEDDFEILQLSFYEDTEFGIQGNLQLWHGDGENFDWENYDDNDAVLSIASSWNNLFQFHSTFTNTFNNKLFIINFFISFANLTMLNFINFL